MELKLSSQADDSEKQKTMDQHLVQSYREEATVNSESPHAEELKNVTLAVKSTMQIKNGKANFVSLFVNSEF